MFFGPWPPCCHPDRRTVPESRHRISLHYFGLRLFYSARFAFAGQCANNQPTGACLPSVAANHLLLSHTQEQSNELWTDSFSRLRWPPAASLTRELTPPLLFVDADVVAPAYARLCQLLWPFLVSASRVKDLPLPSLTIRRNSSLPIQFLSERTSVHGRPKSRFSSARSPQPWIRIWTSDLRRTLSFQVRRNQITHAVPVLTSSVPFPLRHACLLDPGPKDRASDYRTLLVTSGHI